MFAIWAPKIAGFLAALLVAWAAQHNMALSETQVTATFIGIFKIIETLLSRWLNPGNVTAPELVDAPRIEAAHLRTLRKTRRSRGRS